MNDDLNNAHTSGIEGNTADSAPHAKPKNSYQLFFNMLFIAGFAVMLILYFASMRNAPRNIVTGNAGVSDMKIAYVNTDSVWEQYDFVVDVKLQLAEYEKSLQDQYNSSVAAFQKEYNDYLKKGTAGMLTLDEQKKTEEKLAQKQQALAELDQKLTAQLMEEKEIRNREVHDSIVNYIARFNKTHNYSIIFEKSYGGGLLFVNDSLEITPEITRGLNEEYKKFKPVRFNEEKE